MGKKKEQSDKIDPLIIHTMAPNLLFFSLLLKKTEQTAKVELLKSTTD